jgi:RNA polymerase sigma factor (sigma-70 family)
MRDVKIVVNPTGGKAAMSLRINFPTSTNTDTPIDLKFQRLTEVRLLAAAKSGKSEAFEALCENLRAKLFKTAFRITRNREDAEDALQDSLMSAFVHIQSFHGKSRFATWLTRIVINSALMICRKSRNARQISADDASPSEEPRLTLQIPDRSPNPEQRYLAREREVVLHRVIGGLRPRLRAVVQTGQLHELSMKETAKVLDISVAAAKGRFFHGRAALRRSAALRAVSQARTEPAA